MTKQTFIQVPRRNKNNERLLEFKIVRAELHTGRPTLRYLSYQYGCDRQVPRQSRPPLVKPTSSITERTQSGSTTSRKNIASNEAQALPPITCLKLRSACSMVKYHKHGTIHQYLVATHLTIN